MNRETISSAVDNISDEYIAEAGKYTVSAEERRDGMILRYVAAACAAVFAFAIIIPTAAHVIKLASNPGPGTVQPGATAAPGDTVRQPATDGENMPDVVADEQNRIGEAAADLIENGTALADVIGELGQPSYIIGDGLFKLRYVLEGDAGVADIYSTRRVGVGYFVSGVNVTRFNMNFGEPYAPPADDGHVSLSLANREDGNIFSIDEPTIDFRFDNRTGGDVVLHRLYMLEKQTVDGWRSVEYGRMPAAGETESVYGVTFAVLDVHELFGMLSPGKYRIHAVADGAGGEEYSASCEFYIAFSTVRLLGEMLEVDADNFVPAEDAGRVTSGMSWRDVTDLLGKPADVLETDPLRVRYVCEGGESGIDVTYEYGANGSPQYSVIYVDRWSGVAVDMYGMVSPEAVSALIEEMRESSGRMTAAGVKAQLGSPQRMLGAVAEYVLEGGGSVAVEYTDAEGSVVSTDTVAEIRYVPAGELPTADDILARISVGMTTEQDELIGALGIPNVTYADGMRSRAVYFTRELSAVDIYIEYDEELGRACVTEVREKAGTGMLYETDAARYIKAGFSRSEFLALLGVPHRTLSEPYDGAAVREADYRTKDGMLKLLLDGDGTVIGAYFFEPGGDDGLLSEYPINPKNSIASPDAYINAGESFDDVTDRYGLPTRFTGYTVADELIFTYDIARGEKTTFNVKFRAEIYIGGDGVTYRTLVAIEGYYL